jgi:hypothetical protein
MTLPSPTLEGFRVAFRTPSLTLAEIAWRWTTGATAGVLFLFGFIEFLGTLAVNNVDATLLKSKQPMLVGRAIIHILRGNLSRATSAALMAALAASLLWIIAASIGRSVTVRGLLEQFNRDDLVHDPSSNIPHRSAGLGSLFGLNFLRAGAVLAAMLAFVGAAILAGFASTDANPQPGLSFIIFMMLAVFICMAWATLNWILSLGCVFAVRDGEDALGALSAAVTFLRDRTSSVFAVSIWTGIAHVTALFCASTVASLAIAFIQISPARLIVAAVVLVMLAYFAVVDWLYIARLAGYVCISEMPQTSSLSASSPIPPPTRPLFGPSIPTASAVDRDELILGDVPHLATDHA